MYHTKCVKSEYFKLLLLGGLLCLLACCSPQKRLNRILNKHPELIKSDTVFNDTTIYIPSKELNGSIKIEQNFDSLLNVYTKLVNSKDTNSIHNKVEVNKLKNIIVNYKSIKDTITKDSIGIRFAIWQEGKYIRYKIKIDEDSLRIRYATTIKKFEPLKFKWWQSVLMYLGLLFLIVLIVILITRYVR